MLNRNRNVETFLGCENDYEESRIVLYGAPFDSTTSYRPGTRFASRTMRAESYGLETYSPYQDLDLEDAKVFDGGDLELCFGDTERALADIEACARDIVADGKLPFLIGGEHLVTLHLLVLGFSPAADALSLDARHKRSARAGSSVRYGWPIRLLAIVTVVTYFLAAVAKIRVSGWAWVDGTTLGNHIAYSATRLDLLGEPRPPLSAFVIRQEALLGPMALVGLGVELSAPLALLGGWFRRVWVPMARSPGFARVLGG